MMTRLRRTIGACVLASTLLPTIATHAATYYVATNGNNSNPGTSSQPWRTIAYAVSKMGAGDTTYVQGGTYKEGEIRFVRSGTQSAPIKLLNQSGQFPVIDCIDKNKYHRIILLGSGSTPSSRVIGWVTIEGFEIRNCYNGIKFENASNLTIRRNWIHDNSPGSGILGFGTRVLIDRNKINHNTSGHGIYGSGTAFTITNNLIYDNRSYGIQLNGSSSSQYNSSYHAGPDYALSANWSIINNTFAYNVGKSGIVVWGSTCKNARIENNIFYENGVINPSGSTQGIDFVGTSCTGIQIRNNLSYASGSGSSLFLGLGATAGVHYTQSGNIVNTVHPKFVNAPATLPSSPNFALASGSPAIDKGLSHSVAQVSYSGTTRPKLSGYDIGAYEYYSGSTQLAAPTSLQTVN